MSGKGSQQARKRTFNATLKKAIQTAALSKPWTVGDVDVSKNWCDICGYLADVQDMRDILGCATGKLCLELCPDHAREAGIVW